MGLPPKKSKFKVTNNHTCFTTSFSVITLFSETDNILKNAPTFMMNMGNIVHKVVSPT